MKVDSSFWGSDAPRKRFFLFCCFAVLCFFPSYATASPRQGRASSVYGDERLMPSQSPLALRTLNQSDKAYLRTQVYIPGPGRLRFTLNRERHRETLPFRMGATGGIPDGGGITLLQGYVVGHHFESPVGASLQFRNNTPVLTMAFLAPSRVRGREQFYRLTLNPMKPHEVQIQRLTHGVTDKHCGTKETESVAIHHDVSFADRLSTHSDSYLDLSIDADRFWYDQFSGNSNTRISQYVNEVEAVYAEQLGVRFRVLRQKVHMMKSYGTTNAVDTLYAYKEAINESSSAGTFDVSHLFTGKNLDGGVIGIAFIGSLCSSTSAYGVNQFTSDILFPVTFAHELGHNFNAVHSDDGIMGAVATGEGLSTLRFSDDSLSTIEMFIESVSCLNDSETPIVDPTPLPTATPVPSPQPSPVPTVTPQPPDTGTPEPLPGGGAGSSPENASYTFSLHLDNDGRLQLFFQINERNFLRDTCQLELRYSKKRRRAITGKRIISIPVDNRQLVRSRQILFRMKRRKKKNTNFFVAGEFICPGQGIAAGLPPQRINPARIRIRGKKLGTRAWFSALGQALGF